MGNGDHSCAQPSKARTPCHPVLRLLFPLKPTPRSRKKRKPDTLTWKHSPKKGKWTLLQGHNPASFLYHRPSLQTLRGIKPGALNPTWSWPSGQQRRGQDLALCGRSMRTSRPEPGAIPVSSSTPWSLEGWGQLGFSTHMQNLGAALSSFYASPSLPGPEFPFRGRKLLSPELSP